MSTKAELGRSLVPTCRLVLHERRILMMVNPRRRGVVQPPVARPPPARYAKRECNEHHDASHYAARDDVRNVWMNLLREGFVVAVVVIFIVWREDGGGEQSEVARLVHAHQAHVDEIGVSLGEIVCQRQELYERRGFLVCGAVDEIAVIDREVRVAD